MTIQWWCLIYTVLTTTSIAAATIAKPATAVANDKMLLRAMVLTAVSVNRDLNDNNRNRSSSSNISSIKSTRTTRVEEVAV